MTRSPYIGRLLLLPGDKTGRVVQASGKALVVKLIGLDCEIGVMADECRPITAIGIRPRLVIDNSARPVIDVREGTL